jgi:hypothetical protein
MRRELLGFLGVVLMVSVPSKVAATPMGVLEQLSPLTKTYLIGEGLDFVPFELSALDDVTAPAFAVDFTIPGPQANTSTSGCEAVDFAGFPAGGIALIQRGTCPFNLKVLNAFAAGAVGVLVFNEGTPGRTEAFEATLNTLAPLPAVFTSFAVGFELVGASLTEGAVVHMQVTDNTPTAAVPEPATLALVGVGLGAAARRRRQVRRPTPSKAPRIMKRGGVRPSPYWSATTEAGTAGAAWKAGFGSGAIFSTITSNLDFFWCVRGGHGPDAQ